ncbi:MAG: GlsB/YeaQ/YmgE family stress response membrane protein [Pseudohongiellaceae bacterium]|jgi:uncharacterized membrane protein YeaQ/YmgE (transglycosylase-associated protein family)
MDISSLISVLIIGAIAGWLAGNLYKGKGFGIVGNIAVGIVGAFVGSFIFTMIGLSAGGLIGNIIMSTLGAVVLLWFVSLLKKA